MGLSWNSWYNPLDNISEAYKGITNGLAAMAGAPTRSAADRNIRAAAGRAPSGSSSGQVQGLKDEGATTNNGVVDGGDTVGSGGGGGGSAKTLDTAGLTSLDSLIASLATIRDTGFRQAMLKRDEAKTTKEREREREEDKYEGGKLATLQDFSGAKTDTDLGTTQTIENLMSSLSTLGLGGSRALTRQILDAANMSNRKANETQAKKNQEFDSSWNQYEAGYQDDMDKIRDQFKYDEGETLRKYLQDKQSALYKKADIYGAADQTGQRDTFMSEGDALNSRISNAPFANPKYTGASRAMETPELADYTQDIAKYDTTGVQGANVDPLTPVASDGMNNPSNLAVRAIAVNDKDLGIKKKAENDLGYGV